MSRVTPTAERLRHRRLAVLALIAASSYGVWAQVPARQGPPLVVPPEVSAAVAGGGETPVIIGVSTVRAFQPEPTLAVIDAAQQRTEIAQAQAQVIAELSAAGITTSTPFATIPFISARINAAALLALQASPLVASIEEDRAADLTLSESTALIRANVAWATSTGSGWTVAILDSGVDKAHSFLS